MEDRKRILFVLPFLPYPLDSGGAQAMFNGVNVVKDVLDVFVTYRSYGSWDRRREKKMIELWGDKVLIVPCNVPKKDSPKPSFKQKMGMVFFKIEKRLKKLAGLGDLIREKKPYEVWVMEDLSPKETFFLKHVLKIVEDYRIDIVQCEMLRNITLGLELPKHVRKVFVHHELGWVVHELELLGKSYDVLEQKTYLDFYRSCEVALLNYYDDVVALSAIDANKLREAGVAVPIHTSLAVVNTPTSQLLTAERWNVLSFVGPECNTPNVEGLRWFLNHVWERLRMHDSSYKLQIIGKWNSESIADLMNGHENIEYLGFVEDLPSILKDTIMVVPITIGSGIRMKILEAASIGVPIVTTTVGAEGIPVENGVHCFLADAPCDFLESIVKLQDSELRRRFAVNANQLVKEFFSVEALKRNRLEIYRIE